MTKLSINENIKFNFVVGVLLFLAVIGSRLLPHAANYSPSLAVLLFGGSLFGRHKSLAYFIPLLGLFFADAYLGFYDGMVFNYLAYIVIVSIGQLVSPNKLLSVMGGSVGASVLFYMISNFGVWAMTPLYAKTVPDLLACYVMALPFFYRTIVATMGGSILLYGTYKAFCYRALKRRV